MEGWIFALVIIIGAVSGAPSYDKGDNAVLCDVCHVVVQQVKALISKEQTKESAISYLENVCIQLSDAEKELCRDFIHSKSPKVFTELISQLDSMEVCFMLPNVCPRRTQEVPLLVEEAEEEPVILKSEPVHENVQDTLECEICKYIVTTLDTLVGENKTEAAINATLTKICQSLPGALGQLCMQVEPNLLKALENGFDPQKACTAVKLCKTVEEIKEEPIILQSEPVHENMEDTLECEICKYIVTTLDTLVGENKTEAAINATLMKICQSLPGALGQLCMQVEPNLLKALENGFDPQKACTAVKLCKAVEEIKEEPIILQSEPVHENMEDTLECEICKYIVTTLDTLVGENKTEAAINATLMKICQSLPGALGQLCMQVEPNLLKALENGFDPQKACTAVKLCKAEETKEEPIILQSEPVHETMEDTLECEICKYIVTTLDTLVGENKTEAAINATLMKICQSLPGALGQLCMQVEPNLLKALENGFDPQKACTAVKLCKAEETKEEPIILQSEPVHETMEDTLECEICKYIVTTLDTLVGENKTEAAINATLTKICQSLPGALGQLCMQVEPNLLKALENGFDPQKACTAVKLCKAVEETEEEPIILQSEAVHENMEDTLECEICKYIVTTLDTLVGENKTEAAINATLMKICQSLPGALGQLCMQVEPNLLKALENGFDPQKACTAVKLCKAVEETKEEPIILQSEPVHENMEDTLECEICKYIVTTLDTLVGENKTEAAINATLTKICQSLPGALGQLCMQVEPNLLKALENGFDPQKACTAVKLCKTVEEIKEGPIILKSEPVHENIEDTLECEICKYIVTTLDTLVGENKTEAAINATLMKICQSLPGALGQLCMQVEPSLVKALENGFDPQKACTAVKLCKAAGKKLDLPCDFCYTFLAEIGVKNAEKICSVMDSCKHETDIKKEIDQATYSEEPEDDLECNLCKFIVSSLDQLLGNNKTEAAINSTLMKICNSLPGELGQICIQAEPNLVKALENGFGPEKTCKAIKMCNSDVGKFINPAHIPCDVCQSALEMVAGKKGVEACFDIPGVCLYEGEVETNTKHEPAKADAKCELCKFIVDLLEYYIAENATDEKIKNTLDSICDSLPEGTKEMCQDAAQAIVKLLKDRVDPATACQVAKFCSASSSWINLSEMECDTCHHFLVASNPETFKEEVTNLLCNQACHHRPTRSIKKNDFINEFPVVNKKGKLQKSTSSNADIKCDLCRFAVTELDSLLGKNRTDAAINSTLNSICAKLPAELSLLCKMAIPSIMKAVENGFDPDKTCTAAKLCNEPVELTEKVTDGGVSTIGCDICEFLVAEADNILKENKSKDALNATLFKVCDQLPAEIKLTCEVLVPQIVIVLSNGANPKKACSSIHLCTGSNDVNILQGTVPQEKKPEDTVLCELCQLLVTEGDKELQQNKTIAALNATLYKTCAKLPKSYALFCDLLVPEIVSLLAKGFSPKNVCIAMHLCTNSSTALTKPDEDPFSAAVKSLEPLAPRDCQLCRKVMEFVDGDLIKNYEKIRGFIIGNVCNKLPDPTSLACIDMAKTKLEKVWEAVLSKMSSDQLCKLGNLC